MPANPTNPRPSNNMVVGSGTEALEVMGYALYSKRGYPGTL